MIFWRKYSSKRYRDCLIQSWVDGVEKVVEICAWGIGDWSVLIDLSFSEEKDTRFTRRKVIMRDLQTADICEGEEVNLRRQVSFEHPLAWKFRTMVILLPECFTLEDVIIIYTLNCWYRKRKQKVKHEQSKGELIKALGQRNNGIANWRW